ncbi:MAG: cryptochrome/photolyase family protein [Bacillota bacterium]
MHSLILLSHQLNTRYIQNRDYHKVYVVLTKEQFKAFRYHHFRIITHISAAKHFALENGFEYLYENTWEEAFQTLDKKASYDVYEPVEHFMRDRIDEAFAQARLDVTRHTDINFFIPAIEKELKRPPYKLDPLYKAWRRRFNVLMVNGKPLGGRFSFDQENRARPPKNFPVEGPRFFKADTLTEKTVADVKTAFADHPTSTAPFRYPVTRADALKALEDFIHHRLKHFGRYQDAMKESVPFMAHSLLSAPINLGLLFADEVVARVSKAYNDGIAPIEAVEGFIRQVLGWREYIRGIYLVEGPHYKTQNVFGHAYEKPAFLYDGKTSMHCLKTVVHETLDHAYNHHIERLMIIGNLANLLEVHPDRLRMWFNEMYIDAFDWVVTPNVIGMALYADGGRMSTKPYITSANYIQRMSDYCKGCRYDPKAKTGPDACPVNALYYQFLDKHEGILRENPRMAFMYKHLDKLDKKTLKTLKDYAHSIMCSMHA